ncbi:MAG: DUF1294 domain-containing protein [Erythrobacter sp.]|nr:DUF1294 domain-containing protein [Erythrobacter sp.]
MDLLIPLLTPLNIALYLIAINFVAFASFGIDKARAENGWRRTSEANLLALALIGGTPGAYAGRKLFRHKTRKQPFSSQLHTIAILQIAALVGLGVFLMP